MLIHNNGATPQRYRIPMYMAQGQWQMQNEERECCEICGRGLQDLPGLQLPQKHEHVSPTCLGRLLREKRENLEAAKQVLDTEKLRTARAEYAEADHKHGALLRLLTQFRAELNDESIIFTEETGFTRGEGGETVDVLSEIREYMGE